CLKPLPSLRYRVFCTTKANPLELAKKGHPQAIAYLINRQLKPQGIVAKFSCKDASLKILLEAADSIDQKEVVSIIYKGVCKLDISGITELTIYGKKVSEDVPSWNQNFKLHEEFTSVTDLHIEGSQNTKAQFEP
ncbi:MAG: hypothetical protein ACO34J_07740, partial [Prochlorothrix sp.]